MASLQSRLNDLITAIGADIKLIKNRVDEVHATSQGNQSGFSTDTLLVGSVVAIPTGKIKDGTKYRVKFNVVKTAAGVAAPVFTVRLGTAGTAADAAKLTLTMAPQTGAIDEGVVEVECSFRGTITSSILQGIASLGHRLAATGLSTSNHSVAVTAAAAADYSGANLKLSLSVNGGASAAWTVNVVNAELTNLVP